MLEANKSRVVESLFAVYNQNLLRRKFNSFFVSGLEVLLEKSQAPTVIYANHSAWWDGLVAFQISRITKSDSFIMMEEKQLADLFVFRRLGAFSVVRENAREAFKSVEYAVKILHEKPFRTLWIFPQGEILPNDARPLIFFNGLAHIVKKLGVCRIINLAMRYEFLGTYKPEIFVRINEMHLPNFTHQTKKNSITETLAAALTANLEQLKVDIINKQTIKYRNII